MTDKTLPERMREAADTQEEVSRRHGLNERDLIHIVTYPPAKLRTLADEWEREDDEKAAATAAYDAHVEELASTIYHSRYPGPPHWDSELEIIRDVCRDSARAVIAAGWRKTEIS